MTNKELLDELTAFYKKLDATISKIEKHHKKKLNCGKGCKDCCIDGITVFEVEAFYIKHYNKTLGKFKPVLKDDACCCFLNEVNECIIYETRPYVCRTQGLPLRWLDELETGEIIEMRDICPLNEKSIKVESLPQKQVWRIGPFEEKLASLQFKYRKSRMKRVTLKSLLKHS